MGILSKEIKIAADKGIVKIKALFDTGASYSFINKTLATKIATLTQLYKPLILKTANSKQKMIAQYRISADFYINRMRFSDIFIVLDNLTENLIIGAATMQKWDIKLDLKNKKLILNPETQKFQIV